MAKNKYIETPKKLWEHFEAYVQDLKDNPVYIIEQKKGAVIIPKGASMEEIREMTKSTVDLPVHRPFTMEGFELYCFKQGIISDLGHYFSNHEQRYNEYLTICSIIKKAIRQNQIEGGMCGYYNASITARLNGLTDKTDVTSGGAPLQNYNVTLNLGGPVQQEVDNGSSRLIS